ncbi:MAG: hypothetical protein E7520_00145 [Ruminococcaceae bacterium]|nr:hypothetical protein [Oscillospiraceae bacterium]
MANNTNKKGFSIRRLIFNDKYLIITSIILAVIVWVVTSLNIGTDETKTIKVDVPIKLGDEVSEQLGMQYYTLQDTIELNITITGAKYAIGQVTENDLSIKFDTSNVNRTGEQSIPILVTKSTKKLDFTVSSIYPSSVDAYFDVNEAKTFDLYLRYNENAAADGYTFGQPVLSEDKVIISGPKTYVDKVDRAVVDVDFASDQKLKEPYTSECAITVEGTGVEASYLKFSPKDAENNYITTVSVTLPILKVAKLPVSISIDDKPKDFDEKDISISYEVDSIEAGVLESANIKSVDIGSVSFSELKKGRNEFTFDVTALEGVSVLDSELKDIKVVVRIAGDYTAKTVTLNPSDIKIAGVSNDKKASLSNLSSRRVTVYVPTENAKDDITLSAKCDLGDNDESGTYPLTFTVNGNASAWVYGEYTADVTIK